MRWLIFLLILVVAVVSIAMNRNSLPSTDNTNASDQKESDEVGEWRFTAKGWQKATFLNDKPTKKSGPIVRWTIHPLAFAMLQILLSIAALIAFDRHAQNDERS